MIWSNAQFIKSTFRFIYNVFFFTYSPILFEKCQFRKRIHFFCFTICVEQYYSLINFQSTFEKIRSSWFHSSSAIFCRWDHRYASKMTKYKQKIKTLINNMKILYYARLSKASYHKWRQSSYRKSSRTNNSVVIQYDNMFDNSVISNAVIIAVMLL